MPGMFLTREELAELTGYRITSRQRDWLRSNGIRHWINARNRVVVPRAEIEGRHAEERQRRRPDFTALG